MIFLLGIGAIAAEVRLIKILGHNSESSGLELLPNGQFKMTKNPSVFQINIGSDKSIKLASASGKPISLDESGLKTSAGRASLWTFRKNKDPQGKYNHFQLGNNSRCVSRSWASNTLISEGCELKTTDQLFNIKLIKGGSKGPRRARGGDDDDNSDYSSAEVFVEPKRERQVEVIDSEVLNIRVQRPAVITRLVKVAPKPAKEDVKQEQPAVQKKAATPQQTEQKLITVPVGVPIPNPVQVVYQTSPQQPIYQASPQQVYMPIPQGYTRKRPRKAGYSEDLENDYSGVDEPSDSASRDANVRKRPRQRRRRGAKRQRPVDDSGTRASSADMENTRPRRRQDGGYRPGRDRPRGRLPPPRRRRADDSETLNSESREDQPRRRMAPGESGPRRPVGRPRYRESEEDDVTKEGIIQRMEKALHLNTPQIKEPGPANDDTGFLRRVGKFMNSKGESEDAGPGPQRSKNEGPRPRDGYGQERPGTSPAERNRSPMKPGPSAEGPGRSAAQPFNSQNRQGMGPSQGQQRPFGTGQTNTPGGGAFPGQQGNSPGGNDGRFPPAPGQGPRGNGPAGYGSGYPPGGSPYDKADSGYPPRSDDLYRDKYEITVDRKPSPQRSGSNRPGSRGVSSASNDIDMLIDRIEDKPSQFLKEIEMFESKEPSGRNRENRGARDGPRGGDPRGRYTGPEDEDSGKLRKTSTHFKRGKDGKKIVQSIETTEVPLDAGIV